MRTTLAKAMAMIEHSVGPINAMSNWYTTQAWGPVQQADFINVAIKLSSQLPASLAMLRLLQIEQQLKRRRDVPYGPRTIDIDMLFYGQYQCHCKVLTVPHPQISKRRFVLQPLMDIIPNWQHPKYQLSIKALYQQCSDPLNVQLC